MTVSKPNHRIRFGPEDRGVWCESYDDIVRMMIMWERLIRCCDSPGFQPDGEKWVPQVVRWLNRHAKGVRVVQIATRGILGPALVGIAPGESEEDAARIASVARRR